MKSYTNTTAGRNILITGGFRFPDKDAASQRVLGIGKAIRENNYNVVFAGWENASREEDLDDNLAKYVYEGFDYFSQNELDIKSSNIIKKLFVFLFRGKKTIKWIREYIKHTPLDYIIVYNANAYFIFGLLFFCRAKKIKLICDCTEWYEGSHLPGGEFGLANLDNNIRMKIAYPMAKNIIVISSFLKKYLDRKNCSTIIVPPLIDPKEEKWKNIKGNDNDLSVIKLIYAGDPGKKDLLEGVLNVLKNLNNSSIRFELNLVGITEDTFKKNYFHDSAVLPAYIICHGRVPMQMVPQYYNNCHFSVLMRENKRYANAGFPTKFVESLTAGVPVITNLTSDIGDYIKEGENGFIVTNLSEEALYKCLTKAAELNNVQYDEMKANAAETASKYFSYEKYSDKLVDFLEKL